MSGCEHFRELLCTSLDGPLEAADERDLRHHLHGCAGCRELADAMTLVSEAGTGLGRLDPPRDLHDRITGSACRRWQSLLFRAVDEDIDEDSLECLLTHLEECEACSSLWADLTLVRQVGGCLEPPAHLRQRCIWGIKKNLPMPVIGRRTAVAVAYALTVMATLVVGNPVTLARNPAAETLRTVAGTVSEEVAEVTDDGRGELRVMLWRAWTWTRSTADTARELLSNLENDTDSNPDQGDQT